MDYIICSPKFFMFDRLPSGLSHIFVIPDFFQMLKQAGTKPISYQALVEQYNLFHSTGFHKTEKCKHKISWLFFLFLSHSKSSFHFGTVTVEFIPISIF